MIRRHFAGPVGGAAAHNKQLQRTVTRHRERVANGSARPLNCGVRRVQ
jgi:hypothetical protein